MNYERDGSRLYPVEKNDSTYNAPYSAFAEASHLLLTRENWQSRGIYYASIQWRHHGLGMLQGELSENLRVHIWHPKLRTMNTPLRDVHDHRFTLTSHVLYGAIEDVCYHVEPTSNGQVPVYSIRHAKTQKHDASDLVLLGKAHVEEVSRLILIAGDTYVIPRRAWHTTRLAGPALTVVHRSDFDQEPARVLVGGDTGINLDTRKDLISEVVSEVFSAYWKSCP